MNEPTVNIPLLRKAVEWAEAEAARPERESRWNQAWWAVKPQALDREASCGTCYCIAGYIVSLDGATEALSKFNPSDVDFLDADGRLIDPMGRALELLGLGCDDHQGLFVGDNTIEDVRRIAESIAGEAL